MSFNINMRISSWLSALTGIRYPLPENYHNWNKMLKLIWSLYADALHITFLIEVCSLMVRISQSPDDLGIFCACFVGVGYTINLILKLIIFARYNKLFNKLFNEMRELSSEFCRNPFDEGYEGFYNDYFFKVVKIALLKGGIEEIATIALIVIFIFRSLIFGVPEDLITPALSWTPYDNSENPLYSLTCFFELIVYGSVTLRNAALDFLFWLMLIVPTIQLRYLRILLNIIMEEKEVDMYHAENAEEAKAVQRARNKELASNFIWWVKHHQRVLGIIQEFKKITSPYLGVNYLTTLLLLTLAGLVAISTSSWNIYQQLIINGIVISNTVQLYLISLAGDWLSESSEEAVQDGFKISLFSAEKSLRKDYLFACARSKRSLEIRFGGINRLCSENFEQLIRLTITYLVTIVQLRNEGKAND